MTDTLQQHLTEYRSQIEEHRRAIIALTGAVQALERLEQESKEAESGDTTIRDQD
jgi:uncharacterized protein (DUF342 family)